MARKNTLAPCIDVESRSHCVGMAAGRWSLTDEHRQETVRRTSENLFALAYSRGRTVSDKEAARAAARIEEKAYTVAGIESQTTTGQRPFPESLKAYIRKLAALLTEWVASEEIEQNVLAPVDEVVDLTGAREFLTKESAEQALAPLLVSGSAVQRLKLSTKSFGLNPDNSAEVVARAIEASARSLTDVDLSDIIAGRPEVEALAALRTICTALGRLELRRLDLSDNALGEKGVRACAEAFSNQKGLEWLAFQNVGCSINACAAVRELLQHPGQLRTFHFYNNMSDDAGASSIAEILSRSPNMEDFKMASSRVGAEGGIALAKGLSAGQQLRRLDLSDNPMTAEVAHELARLVSSQSQLRALNLNDTSLCDAGVTVLAHALQSSASHLEELELALNEVTADGAKALGEMLQHKKKLKTLVLRENELGDRGAIWLASGLSHLSGLEVLDLTQNQVRRAGAIAATKAVAGCKGLSLLALDENEISDDGIFALKEILYAVGLQTALGPLDENDPDVGGDDEEDGEHGDNEEEDLSAVFAKTVIQ